uniref:Retinoblastoma 1 n=1 Tax=Electrophorus electricus TaxID=8005 RepID=A0A4W4E980_ELEEL
MPPKKRNIGTPPNKDSKSNSKKNSPDSKDHSVISPDKHKEKDSAFVTLCKDLLVTNTVCDHAWAIWETMVKSAEKVNGSNKQLWGACMFISATDMEDVSFTFTDFQKAVGMSVKQFINLLRGMDENVDTISSKVNSVVTRLEKKYEVSLALYQRFIFIISKCLAILSLYRRQELLYCTWIMFLLAKGAILQMEDDLVIAFQLLLCVLEYCTKRCPSDFLQPLYKSAISVSTQGLPTRTSRRNKAKLQLPEVDMQLLETLCKESDCSVDEVRKCQHVVVFILFLFTRAAMNSIQQLRGELTSVSDKPSSSLIVYFKNCTVDPSDEITSRVEQLGQVFSQKFAQAVGHVLSVLQRFTLGVQLYYKVMESILKSEEKRLSVQNFSKLLNNATFHTSLLACALEVVMATYFGSCVKNGGDESPETDLRFPWILDIFHLHAFDFYKVIESFIKAEPTLKHDMIEHLGRCEQKIMESLAWKTDSPLFELLRQSREEGLGEQAEPPATLNQPLQHSHTAADLYLSPQRPSRRLPTAEADSSALPSSQSPTQGPRQLRSNSLSLFYKKLYRMAYLRLKMLFSRLLTGHPELEPIIWTLLQHTLQNEYELMRDRHLDQLLMSSMYAICKVKNVYLLFKTIVTAYKELPNTNQETFKHVLIREGQYDSIIVFYNLVFMQKLKTNILQYSSPRPPPLSPIPHIPRSPYKYPSSPLRVPGGNVYISPLKSSRAPPAAMTPRTRILVSIGESFGASDKFQKINQMVSSSDWSLKRSLVGDSAPKPLKRLRFDVDGQDEADGSRSGGESALIQKLAEMSSARSRMQEQKLKEEAERGEPEA